MTMEKMVMKMMVKKVIKTVVKTVVETVMETAVGVRKRQSPGLQGAPLGMSSSH